MEIVLFILAFLCVICSFVVWCLVCHAVASTMRLFLGDRSAVGYAVALVFFLFAVAPLFILYWGFGP